MSTVASLLAEIDAFLAETGIAATTFGRHAVNDGKFVGRIRSGSGITVALVDRVRAHIATERVKRGLQPRSASTAAQSVAVR